MAKGVQKNETKHQHKKQQAKERKCQVSSCGEKYRAKGYCDRHYKMWRKGTFGDRRFNTCSKEACHGATVGEGLCQTHLDEKRPSKAAAAAPAAEAPAEAKPEAEAAAS
jgi:hypothetical protein